LVVDFAPTISVQSCLSGTIASQVNPWRKSIARLSMPDRECGAELRAKIAAFEALLAAYDEGRIGEPLR
jgi:hypothetical protein